MKKIVLVLLLLVIGIPQITDAMTPAVASFTANPTSGMVPLTVQFTATTVSGNIWWDWQFGDMSDTTDNNALQRPVYTFREPGTYTVTLTVWGLCNPHDPTEYYFGGCINKSSVSTKIVVNGPPSPEANFIATPSSGTIPLTVQFTDSSTNNPTSWEWNFGDGGYSTLQNPSYTFTRVCNAGDNHGSIPVTLTVRGNYHTMSSVSKNIVIGVPTNPVSSFTATPSSGPAPLTVNFADTSSNNPTTWNWMFGDGASSNQQNPSHTYTISGVYTATMQASSSTTCNPTNPATSTITVLSPLAPNQSTTTTITTTAAPNTTLTTATTTIPTTGVTTAETTVLTTGTTAPVVTTSSTPITTRSPTTKVTTKSLTPWPTNTPTQPSPLGVEIGIIAMIGAALLVMRRK